MRYFAKTKRVLALLLTLALVFGAFPLTAFAEVPHGAVIISGNGDFGELVRRPNGTYKGNPSLSVDAEISNNWDRPINIITISIINDIHGIFELGGNQPIMLIPETDSVFQIGINDVLFDLPADTYEADVELTFEYSDSNTPATPATPATSSGTINSERLSLPLSVTVRDERNESDDATLSFLGYLVIDSAVTDSILDNLPDEVLDGIPNSILNILRSMSTNELLELFSDMFELDIAELFSELSELVSDELIRKVPGFTAGVHKYNVALPAGTSPDYYIILVVESTNPHAAMDFSGAFTTLNDGGQASITVTAGDGATKLTYSVDFSTASGHVPVTGVSLNKVATTIAVGGSEALTATVAPENATNKGVTWNSSNATVATVSPAGIVTGVSAGTATITVTTVDGGVMAACEVNITPITDGRGDSSGGGGGSSGSGFSGLTTPQVQWITTSTVPNLMQGTDKNGQAFVRSRHNGKQGVRAAAWAALAGRRYEHDTLDGNTIQVRLYINEPGQMTGDTMVSAWVKGSDVDKIRNRFEKWFSNKIQVVQFDHTGLWGQTVRVAAKLDLKGMDIDNLVFYSYDRATNSRKRVVNPAYWIDNNGYLRFNTDTAGAIIISDGALTPRGQQ